MSSTQDDSQDLLKNSALYQEFLAEREEILRHKWIESEKVGHDIGFEKALLDWMLHHRMEWKRRRLHRDRDTSIYPGEGQPQSP